MKGLVAVARGNSLYVSADLQLVRQAGAMHRAPTSLTAGIRFQPWRPLVRNAGYGSLLADQGKSWEGQAAGGHERAHLPTADPVSNGCCLTFGSRAPTGVQPRFPWALRISFRIGPGGRSPWLLEDLAGPTRDR